MTFDARTDAGTDDAETGASGTGTAFVVDSAGFLPTQPTRRGAESIAVRLIATAGVIGIGTAVGSITSANNVAGWISALAVSCTCVVLSALLWRSRRL